MTESAEREMPIGINPAQSAMVPPAEQDFVGGSRYVEVGDEFLNHFVTLGGLQSQHRVLDVGCGLGRMARSLTGYLQGEGSYEGFDIVPEGIDWCQKEIHSRFPRFRFQLANIYNTLYNPDGSARSEEYVFPYRDREFDFVLLTSVFTHMLAAEFERYVSEIARVLKPSGTVFATFFMLSNDACSLIRDGKSAEDISIKMDNCYVKLRDIPEAAVGYKQAYVERVYGNNELKFSAPVYPGNWCGRRHFVSYQDIVVASKAS